MKDTPTYPFEVSAGAYPNSVWSLVDMSRVFAPCRTAWHFCDLGPTSRIIRLRIVSATTSETIALWQP